MTIAAAAPNLNFSNVLSKTFAAVGRDWQGLAVLVLLLSSLPSLLMLLAMSLVGLQSTDPQRALSNIWLVLAISLPLGFTITAIASAALTHRIASAENGAPASIGDCLSTSLRLFPAVAAIGLIVGFSYMIGLVLLVVPGIIVLLAMAVAAPAEVVERKGVFASIRRSLELTHGNRWTIFGVYFVLGVIAVVLQLIGSGVGGALAGLASGTARIVITQAIAVLIQLPGTMISSVGTVIIYIELRQLRDGMGVRDLAAVFD